MERIHDLVPFVHVADPERSVEFYGRLGMEVIDRLGEEGAVHWAFLRSDYACLMVARASAPIDPAEQAVLLYLYVHDLVALREQLRAAGVTVGAIGYPDHMPEGEMRVHDPGGYTLLIGQRPPPSQPSLRFANRNAGPS